MTNSRHNISNDFIIQNIGDLKSQSFTKHPKYAAGGSLPSEKSVIFEAQSNEILIFDTTYSADSSASPFSFFSGTQDTVFSVSFWIYIRDTPSATANIVGKAGAGGAKREWTVFLPSTGRRINILLRDESTDATIGKYTSAELSQNAWNHVVTTYSGSETSAGCKIYVNGSAVTITTTESGTYSGMDTSAGGHIGTIGSASLKAHLTDISVWNIELTAAEITGLYNSGTPTNLLKEPMCTKDSSNLVVWWRMGNDVGDAIKSGGGSSAVAADNIIRDQTGNSRHALPYTGMDGDEIVTIRSTKSSRPGNATDNPDALSNPESVPLNLVNRGVPNLRKRNTAYKVTKS